MSSTVDANVLVYASNTEAPEHPRARDLVNTLLAGPGLSTVFWPVLRHIYGSSPIRGSAPRH